MFTAARDQSGHVRLRLRDAQRGPRHARAAVLDLPRCAAPDSPTMGRPHGQSLSERERVRSGAALTHTKQKWPPKKEGVKLRFGKQVLLGLCLAGSALFARQAARIDLGRLQTGATVSFTRAAAGEWGIEIAGAAAPRILQPKPAKLEVFRTEADIRQLAAGYQAVQKSADGIDAVWANWGTRGIFIGGAIDNPNITDKEAGMLSMEAYLSLYDSTKEPKWLERAKAAADFAESWIWIWNVPMPLDAGDAQLHWEKGVPTLGFQGITAAVAGSVDEYLDWAVPSYAKLYNLTKDPHYLDVARVLPGNPCRKPSRLTGSRGGWRGPSLRPET
jgi:hypothetical protein